MTPEMRALIEKAIEEGKRNEHIARELHVPLLHVEVIRGSMSSFAGRWYKIKKRKEESKKWLKCF